MMESTITVLTICHNEKPNIRQLLDNVCGWADEIVAIDSGSDDGTIDILEEYGVRVIFHKFENFSLQRKFSLEHVSLTTDWVLVLDADEYMTEELKIEIKNVINANPDIDAYFIKRRFYWQGQWIKRGYYPTNLLRFGRVGKITCDDRGINEHLICKTKKIGQMQNDFVDNNAKPLSDWIDKHNRYSSFEAQSLLCPDKTNYNLFKNQYERKRWIRVMIWNRLPVFVRPFLYLIYRLIIRGGILDGRTAVRYHFLHAFIYRCLIDLKYLEAKERK